MNLFYRIQDWYIELSRMDRITLWLSPVIVAVVILTGIFLPTEWWK